MQQSLIELARVAVAFQEASDFLGRSWWRRTIINLVGGGDRGIHIDIEKSHEEAALK